MSDMRGRLAFIQEAERLKDVLRSGHTSTGRQESTAEHTWRLCLLAMTLQDLLGPLDFERVLKLCVIHDLGEALHGDIPAIHQSAAFDKTQQERHDLMALSRSLPPALQADFLALWEEYEFAGSKEARIVKALDKIETIIQHNQGANPADFDYAFNLTYGLRHAGEHPAIAELRAIVDADTQDKALIMRGPRPTTTAPPMNFPRFYPIGTPGLPWGDAERAQWRARQVRHRSYANDVLSAVQRLAERFDVEGYGEVVYADERFPLMALRSRAWDHALPTVLVTGGVHGYETSGVHGALRFAQAHAQAYAGRVNLLIAPCVSPWAYERIHRWNYDALDPNRNFRADSPAQESAALMRLVAPLRGQFAAHMDLHETTDTDESEYRPAVAARDGKAFEPCTIPDGFYLVDDTGNPQPEFQQAIMQAVQQVTHIAPADAAGGIIGSPLVAPGVIRYAMKELGLCAGITDARYTCTTEVYPDSARTTPEQCIAAQVAAVCAALDFVVSAT